MRKTTLDLTISMQVIYLVEIKKRRILMANIMDLGGMYMCERLGRMEWKEGNVKGRKCLLGNRVAT